jgi:hypothetical protein
MICRRISCFALILLFLTGCLSMAFAQDAASTDKSADQVQDAKKDKKKDKKKKDKGSEDALNPEVFSDDVARNVLNDLRDGFEGHSQRLVISAFDDEKLDGYLSFEDALQAMFARYDEFRVHFRILQSTVEGPKGVILVDFQLEEVPRGTTSVPQRKSAQVRFELERGRKGWKIVDFSPRGFFS